jgi:RNA polymerase sigma factor (sigma-70 family)
MGLNHPWFQPMKKETDSAPLAAVHGGVFQTTHWSVVLAAKNGNSLEAEAALEELCRVYSPALYAYLRRTGHSVEDAQDLVQEFLSRFVHRDWLDHLEDQRGKFRSFLLTFLKHFVADERRRENAQKRGGGKVLVSLDACAADEREALAPMNGLTPDQIYERRWAQLMMARALERLRADYVKRGKAALFDRLQDFQPGERSSQSYAEIAAALGLTVQAVKNASLTFRRRYAEFMRREVAETVLDPREVSAELDHLVRLFGR